MLISITTKYCGKCRETKPVRCFSRNRREADGRQRYCTSCNSAAKYEWTHRNPTKAKAQRKLTRAILLGKVRPSSSCAACGQATKVQGHHPDYNQPLKVIWLCRDCHLKAHQLENHMSNTKGNRWAHDFDCCQRCKTTAYPHARRGICRRCSDQIRKRRLTVPPVTHSVGVDYKIFDYLHIRIWF